MALDATDPDAEDEADERSGGPLMGAMGFG